MVLSTLILVLVLLAAVAGIVWYIHRESHHDCSKGCAGCAIAHTCQRAALVLVAMLVAMTSSGINIEHHCSHCHEHTCSHGDDHTDCDHHHEDCCDHCPNCYFIHFDIDQYDLTPSIDVPSIGEMCKFVDDKMCIFPHLQIYKFTNLQILTSPPLPGRSILLTTSKLSI